MSITETPTQVMPSLPDNGTPPPSPPQPQPLPTGRRWVWAGAIGALVLVFTAIVAIFLLGQQSPTSTAPGVTLAAAYQSKLSGTLTPVVSDNQSLSNALLAIDGSKSSLRVATDAANTLQQQTVASRGALAVLTYPASQSLIQQQATQAITQEAGYVQAVTSTLGDPSNNASGSLQSLASAVNTAFVPLISVAPGGSTSVFGVANLLSWVSGAQSAAHQRAAKPTVVVTPTTTVVTPAPSTSTGVPNSGGLVNQYGNISATYAVSSSLANNVFYQYWADGGASGGSESVSAWSAATGQYYTTTCGPDSAGNIDCYISGTTDPNAEVAFSYSAVAQYTQADADAYVNSGKAGP